jgi:hypothetical protein
MKAAAMLPLLQAWAERQAELDTQMQALFAIFGDGADCPFGIAVWNAWNAYTNTLSALIGDHEFWLTWFEAENEMGRKGLSITSTRGRVRKITNLRQLARVIEECSL